MKRILLFTVFMTVLSGLVNAQCVPDPAFTSPGIYPDSATGFAPACADEPYEQIITVIIPADTTITIGGITLTLPFDSVVVSDWQGLPPGFTYTCNSPNNVTSPVDGCAFEGDVIGCVSLTGNPTTADIGSYQQMITTDSYLDGNPLGNPATVVIDYYYIHITDCTAGLSVLSNSKFMAFPNPATSEITLNGLNGVNVHTVTVTDMNGRIFEQYENIQEAALQMDINYLNSGMYFIRIDYNQTSETIRFMKQ